jgi:hypothetical protein
MRRSSNAVLPAISPGRNSTRSLLFWLTRQPYTEAATLGLLRWRLGLLLVDNPWTEGKLAALFEYLLGTQVRMTPRTRMAGGLGLLLWSGAKRVRGVDFAPPDLGCLEESRAPRPWCACHMEVWLHGCEASSASILIHLWAKSST